MQKCLHFSKYNSVNVLINIFLFGVVDNLSHKNLPFSFPKRYKNNFCNHLKCSLPRHNFLRLEDHHFPPLQKGGHSGRSYRAKWNRRWGFSECESIRDSALFSLEFSLFSSCDTWGVRQASLWVFLSSFTLGMASFGYSHLHSFAELLGGPGSRV